MSGRRAPCLARRCGLGFAACLGLLALACGKPITLPPPLPDSSPVEDSTVSSSAAPSGQTLPDAEKEYIWDIEHHGNLLVKYGFKPMAEALVKSDRSALLAMLAANFSGQTLDKPREVHMTSEIGEATRLEDAGHTPRQLTREEFADSLLEFRNPFGAPPKASFSLMTLSPVKRGDLHGDWQGTAMLRMWGESKPDQPREVTLFLGYRVAQPSRESLGQRNWLQVCAISQSQVAHASRYLMRDVAAERGIDVASLYDTWRDKGKNARGAVGGVYLCDYDRDGYLDVLILDPNRIILYKGLPDGQFKDVTREVGLPTSPMGYTPSAQIAAFVDIDGDGWEDLILGGYVYRNDQGKRFIMTPISPPLPQDAMDITVADYDCDGRIDLYIIRIGEPSSGSWLSGKSGKPRTNLLWRNLGNWRFEDVTQSCGGVDGGGRSTFTAAWLDANNDGLPDLYVINEFGNGLLYVNQGGGKFRAQQIVDHPCDFGTMGVAVGDIDNDGNIDIYAANMYSKAGSRIMSNLRSDAYPPDIIGKMRRFVAGSQLHRNVGNLKFEQMGAKWQLGSVGWAYGPTLVDLDNDGFLDIFATCGYMSRDRNEPDG